MRYFSAFRYPKSFQSSYENNVVSDDNLRQEFIEGATFALSLNSEVKQSKVDPNDIIRWATKEKKLLLDVTSVLATIAYLEQFNKGEGLDWVKCEDMLPEDDRHVLVLENDGATVQVDQYRANWNRWKQHINKHITHWMELPEPPPNK